MANTSMNIRMDAEVKKKAEALFSEIGMTMTTAINIFLKQSIRQNGIPFDVTLRVPNAETIEAIEEVRAMKKNHSLGKTYTNVDDMMKELLD